MIGGSGKKGQKSDIDGWEWLVISEFDECSSWILTGQHLSALLQGFVPSVVKMICVIE